MELIPFQGGLEGGKNEIDSVASPDSVPCGYFNNK